MTSPINALFDNPFARGFFNPKGNVADWRHAARTFVDKGFRLAPKNKFLYHVAFTFTPFALSSMPRFQARHQVEAGVLVKSADLPKYTATVQTLKKYNRNKNVQTNLTYEPINLTFYDDNQGVTTQLMEAYYRYYYNDGNYGLVPNAFNRKFATQPKDKDPNPRFGTGDSTYKGPLENTYRYGLDAGSTDPFFDYIQISQLSRKEYTTYTLVNPTISSWGHGNVDYSDATGTVENTMTVQYEAVWYTRGKIDAGADGDPKHFGAFGYDTVPSPMTLLGGGGLGLIGSIGGVADILTGEANLDNPLAAGIAAANLIGNVKSLKQGQIGEQLAGAALGNITAAANNGGGITGLTGRIVP